MYGPWTPPTVNLTSWLFDVVVLSSGQNSWRAYKLRDVLIATSLHTHYPSSCPTDPLLQFPKINAHLRKIIPEVLKSSQSVTRLVMSRC